ncbi:hypothetical protein AMECASPLE_017350 [Ameca splendens]|uniref:Uncharacterized protein n=1 Tax=Ameca splendens TaxID=208324 RepID=A0ABV0ZBI4_9TELE
MSRRMWTFPPIPVLSSPMGQVNRRVPLLTDGIASCGALGVDLVDSSTLDVFFEDIGRVNRPYRLHSTNNSFP